MRFSKEFLTDSSYGKTVTDRARTSGKKWKELSASQKQTYEDAFKKDQVRK